MYPATRAVASDHAVPTQLSSSRATCDLSDLLLGFTHHHAVNVDNVQGQRYFGLQNCVLIVSA